MGYPTTALSPAQSGNLFHKPPTIRSCMVFASPQIDVIIVKEFHPNRQKNFQKKKLGALNLAAWVISVPRHLPDCHLVKRQSLEADWQVCELTLHWGGGEFESRHRQLLFLGKVWMVLYKNLKDYIRGLFRHTVVQLYWSKLIKISYHWFHITWCLAHSPKIFVK